MALTSGPLSFWNRLDRSLLGFLDPFRDEMDNFTGGFDDYYALEHQVEFHRAAGGRESSCWRCCADSQDWEEVVHTDYRSDGSIAMSSHRSNDEGQRASLRHGLNTSATNGHGSPVESSEAANSGRRFVYGNISLANGAKSFRILCYGDSNTVGFRGIGKSLSMYGAALAEDLHAAGFSCEVTCCGLCGFTSEDLANNINAPYLKNPKLGPPGEGLAHLLRDAGPFDIVIIMVGSNDIGKSMDTRTSLGFVTQLHNVCHTLGIPTVSVAPNTCGPCNSHNENEIRAKARDLRKRLAESMCTWASGCPDVLLALDCETLVPKSISQLWELDELHLSIQGSKRLGKRIASQLAVVLEQLTQSLEISQFSVGSTHASSQSSVRSELGQQAQASSLPSQWSQTQPAVSARGTARSHAPTRAATQR